MCILYLNIQIKRSYYPIPDTSPQSRDMKGMRLYSNRLFLASKVCRHICPKKLLSQAAGKFLVISFSKMWGWNFTE